jgi:hypothetical protein
LTATFPQRRLLAVETWTAGWPKRGATARDGKIDIMAARETAVRRCSVGSSDFNAG